MKNLLAVACVVATVLPVVRTARGDDANSSGPNWDPMKPSEFVWMVRKQPIGTDELIYLIL
jgi:hypothetical protein